MKRKTGPLYIKEDSKTIESDSDEENVETENTIKKVKKESENIKNFGFFRSGSIKLLRSQSLDSINGPFDFLPQEAVVSIFMCLPPKEVCRLSAVCRNWYRIAFDNVLWKTICLNRWEDTAQVDSIPIIDAKQKDVKRGEIRNRLEDEIFEYDWTQPQSNSVDFLYTEGSMDWRRYYWYRDLQSEVVSKVFRDFSKLSFTLNECNVTYGMRRCILVAIRKTLESSVEDNNSQGLAALITKQLAEYLLQTQSQSRELAKIALNCWTILFDEELNFKKKLSLLVVIAVRLIPAFLEMSKDPELGVRAIPNISLLAINYPICIRACKELILNVVVERLFQIMAEYVQEETAFRSGDISDIEIVESSSFSMINSLRDSAEECLDKITMALGAKTILPTVLQIIGDYLTKSDWRYKRSAIMSIALLGEGCKKQIGANLDDFISILELAFKDTSHPNIRWTVLTSISQLCNDFTPTIQETYSDRLVPLILESLQSEDPRIQRHACRAVVNFTGDLDDLNDLLASYQNVLISRLLEFLNSEDEILQAEAVTALASSAQIFENHMDMFYDNSMKVLKKILYSFDWSHTIKNKAIEAISSITMSVRNGQLRTDAHEIMETIKITPELLPQLSVQNKIYLLEGYARLFKALGEEFVKYLPDVMPFMLNLLTMVINAAVYQDDSQIPLAQRDWTRVSLGARVVCWNTELLALKESAFRMCTAFLCQKHGLAPYITQLVPILVQHLNYNLSEEIRRSSAENLAKIIDIEPNEDVLFNITSSLFEGLQHESEHDTVVAMLDALYDCFQEYGKFYSGNTKFNLNNLCKQMADLLKDMILKMNDKREQLNSSDVMDDEEKTKILESVAVVEDEINGVFKCYIAIIKTFRAAFVKLMYKTLDAFILLFTHQYLVVQKGAALLFDTILVYCSKLFQPILSVILNNYLRFLKRPTRAIPDEQVCRSVAAYVVGSVAWKFSQTFELTHKETAISLLKGILNEQVSRSENDDDESYDPSLYENAFISMFRIALVFKEADLIKYLLDLPFIPQVETRTIDGLYGYELRISIEENPEFFAPFKQSLLKLVETFIEQPEIEEKISKGNENIEKLLRILRD